MTLAIEPRNYQKPSTDWFARAGFGIAVHWTSQSLPVTGLPINYPNAVDNFDVDRLVLDIESTGAGYLLFTATHATQHIPAPCSALDRILPGRTTSRDLLMELAGACARKGIHFLVYYNHSCNRGDDPPWENACGYHDTDKSRFVENLLDIIAELGERYGSKIPAWWFDSSPSLDPTGPYNSVSTDMTGFRFPWERYTQAAKAGYASRLVTYNPGMQAHERMHLYTAHQDYLSGEVNDLIDVPTERYAANGLQNHRWVCIDNPAWVHAKPNTALMPPRYSSDQIAAYLQNAKAAQTPVTFNVDIDQSGVLSLDSLKVLSQANVNANHRRQS